MLKITATLLLTLTLVLSVPHLAQAQLPPQVRTALQRACKIDDAFIRYAVIKEAKAGYKDDIAAIDAITQQECGAPPLTAAAGSVENIPSVNEQAAAVAKDGLQESASSSWNGEVTAGLDIRRGNSEKTDLLLDSKLVYDGDSWKNTLAGRAYNSKEDDTRIAEEYRLTDRLDYKLGGGYYAFADLGYVNDRFSGFDYRISEVAGLGRIWVDNDVWLLDTRSGIGARQSHFTTGEDENDMVLKFGLDSRWNISDSFTLSEAMTADIASDVTIMESETTLKSRITDTLSLKTSFNVEHITDVPVGKKKTDTRTNIGVLYEF